MTKRKLTSFEKREMHRLANSYANQAMWSYIEDMKDEYFKDNQVDKLRHRAIKKQAYKRAKAFIIWFSDFNHQNHVILSDERMDD